MNEFSIEVHNVSKIYKLYNKKSDRLKESFSLLSKKYHWDFYALDDVSFKIKNGESVGIIGENGSGKSTILKIISGVLSPNGGNVCTNGKIAALLELGTGFNPEYTGIENIYLNGTMMGYSRKDIDKKVDEIVEFSDIGNFINQPVKTYSSGMFARLAFAVAINVEPDILIVDEALSVGDMYFQEKCYEKMKSMVSNGKTILFVSHALQAVRNFCDRAIWMEKGKVIMQGEVQMVCDAYQEYINSKKGKVITLNKIDVSNKIKSKVFLKNIYLNKETFLTDEDIKIHIELEFNSTSINYGVGLIIYNEEGKIVTLFNTIRDDIDLDKTYDKFILTIPKNDFIKGRYYISVSISDELIMYPYDRNDYVLGFEVKSKRSAKGFNCSEGYFRCKHNWEYYND